MANRVCGSCGRPEGEVSFFKNIDETCRPCFTSQSMRAAAGRPLSERVEKHRQEKILRQELRKIAAQRLAAKKRAKKERARKAIMPEAPPESSGTPVDPAVKELAQRVLARRRLIEFVKEFHPRYKAGWVHHDICRRLEQFVADVAAGKSPRLMLLMPPRHGKSQIASKLFPAWVLGHYPHFEFIASSYNVSLALEFSREVRGVIRTDRYQTLFPKTRLDSEIQAAEAWKLVSPTGVGGGGYVAAGIGGPITGKGAHILVIDDPIKNAEEADSLEQRTKIWDWYKSAAYTRLAPGGGVLVIQTCWHDDDLAGRLQQQMKDADEGDEDVDRFEIIKYPAIATEDEEFRSKGEALHPERYDERALAKIKRNIGPRFWAALYQQDPVPDEGAYFRKDMFVWRREGVNVQAAHIYQAWDFAISEKRQNDYNVGVTVAIDYDDNVHIMEIRRFKTKDAGVIADNMLDMYEKWKRRAGSGMQMIGVEDGQIWRAMQATLTKRMQDRSLYPSFELLKPTTDKQVRARPLQGRMQAGKVTWPQAYTWDSAEIKEMLRFPAGVHDDVVDALAWVVAMLAGRAPPRRPKPRLGKREETVAEKLRKLARTGRGGAMSA